MAPEIILPAELELSARCLEERLKLLHVPTRKVSLSEWNTLSPKVEMLIPKWIPLLLASYSLLGSVLMCKSYFKHLKSAQHFCFWGPAEFENRLSGRDYVINEDIIASGFVPISDESDGDLWVTNRLDEPTSPIYLYEHSGGDRIFASERLALLMASMEISGASFTSFGKSLEPKSVMWYHEK